MFFCIYAVAIYAASTTLLSFAAACFAAVRIQRVQIFLPSIFCRFGFCLRSVLIFEWLRFAARFEPLPHVSHFRAIYKEIKVDLNVRGVYTIEHRLSIQSGD